MSCEPNGIFETIIQQKRERALANRPPTRFLAISPYRNYVFNDDGTVNKFESSSTGYTKNQLDMRRKVEILKYDKRNGKQTSSQRYATLVKGLGRRIGINTAENIRSITQCDLIPKPLSSSNVPPTRNGSGRNQMLVMQPSIPLYNYNVQVGAFPNDNNIDKTTDFYRFHKYLQNKVEYPFDTEIRNIVSTFEMSEPVQFGFLEFLDNIPESVSTVRISTDIFLQFSDISVNDPGFTSYGIQINNEVNPLEVYFSAQDLTAGENISYTSTTYSTNIIIVPGTDLDNNIDGAYMHNIGFTLSSVFDIPSEKGVIYSLKYKFSGITLNPKVNPATKLSFVSNPSSTTLLVT
jgi:hypothetical protein